MKALLHKEWQQARLNVLLVFVAMGALWFAIFDDEDLLLPPGWSDDEPMVFAVLLALFAGLQLGFAQFASESLWKTREFLNHRASGPARAYWAKCAIGLLGSTLFAFGPALVWSAYQRWDSPWQHAGLWQRVGHFAIASTIAWAGWGVAAVCCQLRHGWALRSLATFTGGAGLFGAAALATRALTDLPAWADALYPVAMAGLTVFFALCAGRAYAEGVDDEVALSDRAGIPLALGLLIAAALPLVLTGRAASRFAARSLERSFPHLAVVDGAEVLRVRRGVDGIAVRQDENGEIHEDPRLRILAQGGFRASASAMKFAFDPSWRAWGWPLPARELRMVRRARPFAFGGAWTPDWFETPPSLRHSGNLEAAFEHRTGRLHTFVEAPQPRHVVLETGARADWLWLWGRERKARLLFDPHTKGLHRLHAGEEGVAIEPIGLPDGDRLVGVERWFSRANAEVGYQPPFQYENALLLVGERGRYSFDGNAIVPFEADADADSIPASLADGAVEFRARLARFDALDPELEVVDERSGAVLYRGRLAPRNAATMGSKLLACAATLLYPPPVALASFRNLTPWARRSSFDADALLGGRRPWLLALNCAFAVYLAWNVRRISATWKRSRRLGWLWVLATLGLGLAGWVLFRWCEPKPAAPSTRRATAAASPA